MIEYICAHCHQPAIVPTDGSAMWCPAHPHERVDSLLLDLALADLVAEGLATVDADGRYHHTALGRLAAAVNEAGASWTGLAWDSGPQTLVYVLTRMADGERLTELVVHDIKAVGSWWPATHEGRAQRERWHDLLDELQRDRGATPRLRERAAALAATERAAVEAAAAEARWHGEQAVDEAMGGAWDSAVHELEVACRIERGYGDDPAWRGPLAIARAEADAREWD